MLIRNADIFGFGLGDLRVTDGSIAALATELPHMSGERIVDAGGGALLPGLHDHHIHLAATAVRDASISCGPPNVRNADELCAALMRSGQGWLRGIGYDESVLGGLPNALALDRIVSDRPLRIQHRTGRMWLFNSAGLAELLARGKPPEGLERKNNAYTGRLFDEDAWLAATLGGDYPELSAISRELAAFGVTGVTDLSPRNDAQTIREISAQRVAGRLLQHCVVGGRLDCADAAPGSWHLGPLKLHLHEAALPDFDDTLALIRAAREQGRTIATHCVTEVELVFTLALLGEVGPIRGDRIEHASVVPEHLIDRIAGLGVQVCVQPHFVAERGDRYLRDVDPRSHSALYRLASLADAGIALAGGSDAPYGTTDPWAAMRAAVTRQTAAGALIGPDEAISAESALDLYLRDPLKLERSRRIAAGEPADLCLLSRPWSECRSRLLAEDVVATFVTGECIYQRVDEAPFECLARAEASA